MLDTQQQVARNFIDGTNGSLQIPDGAHVYHKADLDLFKQLTGYNLVQTPRRLMAIYEYARISTIGQDLAETRGGTEGSWMHGVQSGEEIKGTMLRDFRRLTRWQTHRI